MIRIDKSGAELIGRFILEVAKMREVQKVFEKEYKDISREGLRLMLKKIDCETEVDQLLEVLKK